MYLRRPTMTNHENDAGMLSDVDIKEFLNNGITITTSGTEGYCFDPEKQIQLGSIDLHFRHDCKRIKLTYDGVIDYDDLRNHSYTESFEIENGELYIEPGEIILTTTQEIVSLSTEFAGIITGRSSIARLGVMVHCSQEFIYPGYGQTIPLQLVNLGDNTVRIPITSTVCQLILFKLRTPSSGTYVTKQGAKYAGEISPFVSEIYEEFGDISKKKGEEETKKQKIEQKELKTNKTDKNCKRFLGMLIGPIIASIIATIITSSFIVNNLKEITVSSVILQLVGFL